MLGKDLMQCFNLDGSQKATVRSDDPSKLVVSDSNSKVGQAQVEVLGSLCLQGLASEGVAQVHVVSAQGVETVYPVILGPSGVMFFSLSSPVELKTLAAAASVKVGLFVPSVVGALTDQTLRPGVDPVVVAVSSSDRAVVVPVPDRINVTQSASYGAIVSLQPQDVGTAVLRLAPPPAFHTSARYEELPVKVTRPTFTAQQPLRAVRGLLTRADLQFSASGLNLPSSILATTTSNDPSRLLVAASPGDTPQAKITVASNGPPTFYMLGAANGTATVTVSASVLDPATLDVKVEDPTIGVSGPADMTVGFCPSGLGVPQRDRHRAGAAVPTEE